MVHFMCLSDFKAVCVCVCVCVWCVCVCVFLSSNRYVDSFTW